MQTLNLPADPPSRLRMVRGNGVNLTVWKGQMSRPEEANFESWDEYQEAMIDWHLDQRILDGPRCSQTRKPVPEDFETFEEYNERLLDWKIDQRLGVKREAPNLGHQADEVGERESPSRIKSKLAGSLMVTQGEDPVFDLTMIFFPGSPGSKRTSDVLSKAFSSQDPSNWREARKVLDEWSSAGVSPMPYVVIEADGGVWTWLIVGVGDGISGHLEDGSESFYWSEERGFRWWGQERIPATV